MPIRARIILIVLPLVIVAIVITGTVTTVAATSGMTRIAMRLMAFKSAELSKYMYSQWDLLVRNQFADRPEFISAAQYSINDYARTLINNPSELIFALSDTGEIIMSTEAFELGPEEAQALLQLAEEKKTGWVEIRAAEIQRVGEAAFFSPFNWYVLTTDSAQSFYREIREILYRGVLVLVICCSIAVALLLFFSSYLTRPISKMLETIEIIIRDRKFTKKVEVEYGDEIGNLANRFNHMTDNLLNTYNQVKDHAYKEAVARKQVVQREYETLIVLGKAAEFKDPETGAHISRVGFYSRMLAESIGEDEHSQNLIFYAAPLHDIGKMGIPDSILLKPAKLTKEEFEIIKTHTTIAHEILKDSRSPYLKTGAIIALTHHERYDGNGYPDGLRGTEIPLLGRIVGLVDTFDAVTSNRPYKAAWDLDRAFVLLEEEMGKQFDPRLVELFLNRKSEIRRIYEAHRDD
jgi:response regulator RpfG family c-di-GMP phosphodiesterase